MFHTKDGLFAETESRTKQWNSPRQNNIGKTNQTQIIAPRLGLLESEFDANEVI